MILAFERSAVRGLANGWRLRGKAEPPDRDLRPFRGTSARLGACRQILTREPRGTSFVQRQIGAVLGSHRHRVAVAMKVSSLTMWTRWERRGRWPRQEEREAPTRELTSRVTARRSFSGRLMSC